jgi:predicted Zn-dependent protease
MERLELLKSYLARTPGDSFLNHALALEYVKAGRDSDAISVFRALLARDPAYVGSYYHLGAALQRAGDPEGALAVYREGIRQAALQGAPHALTELRQAAEELED